jgi:hypothetical protein
MGARLQAACRREGVVRPSLIPLLSFGAKDGAPPDAAQGGMVEEPSFLLLPRRGEKGKSGTRWKAGAQ